MCIFIRNIIKKYEHIYIDYENNKYNYTKYKCYTIGTVKYIA